MNYDDLIARKSRSVNFEGIEPNGIAPHLFPHQRDLATWALRRGRSAIFADTGLGKCPMALEWARHVATRGRVLILAPLAVAQQIAREGVKFGVAAQYRRADAGDPITVTNYDMMHAFDPGEFIGVVLDESSILKSFDGATQRALTDAFKSTPFRLCCTATPAPNDFTELGTHAEFLGVKTRAEMLSEYFVHDGGTTQDWRLKGHAVASFWRWVATWGAVVKRPSDLGHDDGLFALPDLRMHDHVIHVDDSDARKAGRLFADDAMTIHEQRAVRRSTIEKRAELAASLCAGSDPAVVWVDLNDEGDAVTELIAGAVQVAGSDARDTKEARLVGFSDGTHRVMVSKVSLAGFGLNWQHCRRVIFIGPSHSYEQTYQAIRRCWRFGQTQPVDVHVIRTDADGAIVQNMRRKVADAERMSAEMTAHVGDAVRMAVTGTVREWNPYMPAVKMRVPKWIGQE
jgi:superfamily II DNA or RNA helicase